MKVKLSDVFELQMGKTPPRNDRSCWGKGHKWISISDIGNAGKYIDTTKEEITDIGVSKSGIKVVPKGTVIMSFKLSIGKTTITAEDMYTNEAIMAFVDKGRYEINTDYFYHMCRGIDWRDGTNKAVLGLTLNKATMSEKEIEIPPIAEQLQVVSLLDKIDEMISLRKEQLAKLDQLVKSRFVELFRGEEYPHTPLIELIIEGAGLSYGIIVPGDNVEEGIPMIRPSDFKNDNLCLDNVYRVAPEIEAKYARTRLLGDEILVQVIGQPGQIMLSDSRCKGMNVTRNLAVVRSDCNRINRIYLKTYMQTHEAQAFMLGETKQSTLKQLPLSRLKELEIPVPPMEMQEQFAAFVEQTDKSKLTIQQSLDKLELLKKSLMQQYFG